MKGFTQEHEEVLAKHASLYESLTTAGFMRNIEQPIFIELQKVYHEALYVQHFSSWCPSCIADMVSQLYRSYHAWKDKQPPASEPIDLEKKTTTPSPLKKRN